ncbi:MAG: GxGYxYP family putative glycoside hydrolase [Opitutales bacterium]|nr:GxGYxYP family putative glycoside hydrolase [Opitutales bacterium]
MNLSLPSLLKPARSLAQIAFALALLAGWASGQDAAFQGKWKLIKAESSDLDYFHQSTLDFALHPGEVTIATWRGPRRPFAEKMTVKTDGQPQQVAITDGAFADALFLAVKLPVGGHREVTAQWTASQALKLTERFPAATSQGSTDLCVTRVFELSAHRDLLTCRLTRSTRTTGPELTYVYKRDEANNAYVMQLADDWDIQSRLPEQACLISLQGVVNRQAPLLYFTFGPNYPFNYTEELYRYLEKSRHFSFRRLASLEEALVAFQGQIKGYIVWDKNVRTSLIVAYTLAGLEQGIVITEDLIPLARKYGLREIDDFRQRFTGQSDYQIYAWAKEHYWSRCSREVITWLGGSHGSVLMPAAADYGMVKQTFFSDLSARASDAQEYGLTTSLLQEMKPLGQVWGWHSYKKDTEEEMITLTSSYALTSDGLNTMPNTSFLLQVPATPGFQFKNRHTVVPGKSYPAEPKVYLALVQTDGLGIGAWVRPGRGSLPYAWEVSMKFLHLSPAMLEFYYDQATPNDYFVAALSGSSYMYPRAFPKKWLPQEIALARGLMTQLDLRVFEIMDYAGDRTEAGDNSLPREIVDEYFRGMPDALGFLNGYYAAHTYAVRGQRPLVSYDYYLSATKPEESAAADLRELATLNPARPYFLLVHVRENSDVARVKRICDRLGPAFEVVPLDRFLHMAGANPTFQERYAP